MPPKKRTVTKSKTVNKSAGKKSVTKQKTITKRSGKVVEKYKRKDKGKKGVVLGGGGTKKATYKRRTVKDATGKVVKKTGKRKTSYDKAKEKWKGGQLVLDKSKNKDTKSKYTRRRKVKGDVYTDKLKTKSKGQRASKTTTKEIAGKKSKGTDTYVLQKRKRSKTPRGTEKKAKVGYYVGSGTGKRKTINKVKSVRRKK